MRLGIIGGGPAALLLLKRIVESPSKPVSVRVFEESSRVGCGMPYSDQGSLPEHVTNVSGDELPTFTTSLTDWARKQPAERLAKYGINANDFHEKECPPRLLFGDYLEEQFESYVSEARKSGIEVEISLGTKVHDIVMGRDVVYVETDHDRKIEFDKVIICTGHRWSRSTENEIEGYFDSPYPPKKLAERVNHAVGIRGASLTAVDAIKTLALRNGRFIRDAERTVYHAAETSNGFKITMHSRQGMLPCVRIHMEDPRPIVEPAIPDEEIRANIDANDGFLQLDFLFERGFKSELAKRDQKFYSHVKDMTLEELTSEMLKMRQDKDSFSLMREEYVEAAKSIEKERAVHWKEQLASLSFAMNYPAKHLSAEDMLRLEKTLLPLISVVIGFLPQSSCEVLLALHDAGRLELIPDDGTGDIDAGADHSIEYTWTDEDGKKQTAKYKTFIDCIGQRHLNIDDFPFESLVKSGAVSPASLPFRSSADAAEFANKNEKRVVLKNDEQQLKVPGLRVTDTFRLVDEHDKENERVFLIAVPYIAGYNPDYSGLDFCEKASLLVINDALKQQSKVF